jgi:phosphotransferase system HPr-like phosphotransfer protein
MLAAPCGSILKVTADGEDESQAIEGLQKVFQSKFNEE